MANDVSQWLVGITISNPLVNIFAQPIPHSKVLKINSGRLNTSDLR